MNENYKVDNKTRNLTVEMMFVGLIFNNQMVTKWSHGCEKLILFRFLNLATNSTFLLKTDEDNSQIMRGDLIFKNQMITKQELTYLFRFLNTYNILYLESDFEMT